MGLVYTGQLEVSVSVLIHLYLEEALKWQVSYVSNTKTFFTQRVSTTYYGRPNYVKNISDFLTLKITFRLITIISPTLNATDVEGKQEMLVKVFKYTGVVQPS